MKYHVESFSFSGDKWQLFTVNGFDTPEEAETHMRQVIAERPEVDPTRLRVAEYTTIQERFAQVAAQPDWSYQRLVDEILCPAIAQGILYQDVVREAEEKSGLDHIDVLPDYVTDGQKEGQWRAPY